MRSCGVFWVPPRTINNLLSGRFGELGPAEEPRTVRQGVIAFDLSGLGCEPKRLCGHAKQARGTGQVEPGLNAVGAGRKTGIL